GQSYDVQCELSQLATCWAIFVYPVLLGYKGSIPAIGIFTPWEVGVEPAYPRMTLTVYDPFGTLDADVTHMYSKSISMIYPFPGRVGPCNVIKSVVSDAPIFADKNPSRSTARSDAGQTSLSWSTTSRGLLGSYWLTI